MDSVLRLCTDTLMRFWTFVLITAENRCYLCQLIALVSTDATHLLVSTDATHLLVSTDTTHLLVSTDTTHLLVSTIGTPCT